MIHHLQWQLPEPSQDMLAQLRVRAPATVDPQGRRLPRPLVLVNVLVRQNNPDNFTIFFHHPPALDPQVLSFIRHHNHIFLLFKIRLTSHQDRLQEVQQGRVHLTRRNLQPVPPDRGVRYGILRRPRWDLPQQQLRQWPQQAPRRRDQRQRNQELLDQEWLF